MKRFITQAPLFLATCLSLIIMFILTQFLEPLHTYFPGFSDDIEQIVAGAQDLSNLIDSSLINPRRQENTLYVASASNPNWVDSTDEEQPQIYALAEEPPEEVEPAFVPIESEPLVPTPRASEHGVKYISPVDESYFDDAVFIGDSRTVGLSMYSPFENADYLCDVGMNIYDCLDRDIEFNGVAHTTVRNMLATHTYKKVYIMLGINEISSNIDKYIEKYADVIETIHKYEPDAIIIVQGIMCVGKSKSDTHPHFNNPNIQKRNARLKELADADATDYIYYLDINEGIADEEGNLPSNYSFDQIHLYAQYYYLWRDYLLEHGYK